MSARMFISAFAIALGAMVSGARAQDADIGKVLYGQYCAACHGVDAKGDGPLTEVMTTEVSDLTGLSRRNDGQFPMLEVIHIIDGRTGLRGHGGPMPTFGDLFTVETEGTVGRYASVIETRGRMLSLALYLESVQE